ncbi:MULTISPECIES: PTS glucitol/sorbitol transporter subunit IIA [Streptococcus]|jgi:phosphotransferase enzyme IIA|nr:MULTISPECIES: PTS glucitol/sorbitol transporter subunit IIA [Streptococcus]MBF1713688.1 PTS glucitol/sorbitol transporter subunit IIA [Streptococcus intermedius]PLA63778.1 PTS sorbitol transporter subunit IIA [Streptococcus salivarius]MBZ2057846.1 PTS glucitol/sorbitol transporter subunit IIA [Streptococcus sanguinis]MCC3168106.1 PTS system glucitol/sorbitol-specific IIA component family protein [Streptococcus sanguinis]MCY7028208.1 PTS glucitol/sorbitol transporter subunit IIA [Streptococc
MKKIFEAKVIQVGPEAQNMIQDANMLILFGEEAPEDLAEYCFKIDNKDLLGSIQKGGKLVVDSEEYLITAVGNVVEKNLTGLGHITISFDASEEGSLPGTLHVAAEKEVVIAQGTTIQIFEAA